MDDRLRHELLRCIDRALESLGQTARDVIYWHVENRFGIRREEIVDRPRDFTEALRTFLGPAYWVLERAMIREIRAMFRVYGAAATLEEVIKKAMRSTGALPAS